MFTQRSLKSDCSDVYSVLKWPPEGHVQRRVSGRDGLGDAYQGVERY